MHPRISRIAFLSSGRRALAAVLLVSSLPVSVLRAESGAGAASVFRPRKVASSELQPRAEWRNLGVATPEACFETHFWAADRQQVDALLGTFVLDDAARAAASKALGEMTPAERAPYGSPERLVATVLTRLPPVAAIRVLGSAPHPQRADEVALHWLNSYDDGRLRENRNFLVRSTAEGWRRVIDARSVEMLLRNRLRENGAAPAVQREPSPRPSATPPVRVLQGMVATDTLAHRGNATPLAALETFFWAKARRDFATLERMIVVTPGARAKAEAKLAGLSADARARMPEAATPERMAIAQSWAGERDSHVQVDLQSELGPGHVYFSGRRVHAPGGGNFDLVLRHTDAGWKWFMSDAIPGPPTAAAARR